jgi:hypothetical protein
MIVNRDQLNGNPISIAFENDADHSTRFFGGPVSLSIFGKQQYQWHPAANRLSAGADLATGQLRVIATPGFAEPDGPIARTSRTVAPHDRYEIPAASIVVVRGRLLSDPR